MNFAKNFILDFFFLLCQISGSIFIYIPKAFNHGVKLLKLIKNKMLIMHPSGNSSLRKKKKTISTKIYGYNTWYKVAKSSFY